MPSPQIHVVLDREEAYRRIFDALDDGGSTFTRTHKRTNAVLAALDTEKGGAAAHKLWEAATEHWYGSTDQEDDDFDLAGALFDSSVAYPGIPIKGRELYRIGVQLGFLEALDEEGEG